MKISKFPTRLFIFRQKTGRNVSKFLIANIKPRTISEKFSKNSQTHQIPEDYISKFSKSRISRLTEPEKSKNSQTQIHSYRTIIIFQNLQNYEYYAS